jgi:hypothetical protein
MIVPLRTTILRGTCARTEVWLAQQEMYAMPRLTAMHRSDLLKVHDAKQLNARSGHAGDAHLSPS